MKYVVEPGEFEIMSASSRDAIADGASDSGLIHPQLPNTT